MSVRSTARRFALGVLCVAGLLAGHAAFADENYLVDPSTYGASQSAWQAQWWQWVVSIPVATNPLLDATGDLCPTGQRGPVWFLAGALDSGKVTRSCTVPAGTALFFPVANTICYEDAYTADAAACRPDLTAYMDGWTVTLAVDGHGIRPLARLRGQSGPFAYFHPLDNIFGDDIGPKLNLAIDDGWYAMVKPLKTGKHTLHFTADDGYGNTIDVTYRITVVDVK